MKPVRIAVAALVAGTLVFSVSACSPEKPTKSVSQVQKKSKDTKAKKSVGDSDSKSGTAKKKSKSRK